MYIFCDYNHKNWHVFLYYPLSIRIVFFPFAKVHGTLVRNGIIHRQKKYKDDNGKVIFEGSQVKRYSRTYRNFVN